MAPSLTRLHGERGTCKAVLTSIEKYLNQTPAEQFTEEDLKSRLKSLNRATEKFDSTQSKIYEIIEEDENVFAKEQFEVSDFEERIVNLEARIERLLKKFTTANQTQGTSTIETDFSRMATAIAQAVQNGQGSRPKVVKLPQLTIPKFSGKYTDWQSFKDIYKSCIHNNADLTAAQKFSYLKGYLEGGEAESVIKHLAPSDNNYNDAWKLLERRFDKKQCILSSHIDMFFSQQCVPDNNPAALRSLLNVTLESINAVDALGHKERDVWLINFVLRKVDPDTHTLWTREFPQTEVPSWDDFQDFLERRCDSLEVSHSVTIQREKQNVNVKGNKVSKTTLTAQVNDTNPECGICKDQSHQSYQCPEFVSAAPAQRLQIARNSKLCFNCLQTNHTIDACQRSSCRRCRSKHNTMLHQAFSNSTGRQVTQVTSATPVTQVSASESPEVNTIVVPEDSARAVITTQTPAAPSHSGGIPSSLVSNSPRRAVSNQILLPTAIIMVRGGDGKLHKGRALIDSCSQSNLVTTSFARRSRLPIFIQDDRVVSGIGQNTATVAGATRFTFTSQDGQFSMTQDFLILDNIVNDQPSSTFDAFWDIPKGIQLADAEYNICARVDIILGADVFIRSLRPGRIEGSPILQQTAFGYIIVGSVPCSSSDTSTNSCIITCLCSSLNKFDTLHQEIERFWHLEEPSSIEKVMSTEEQLCEEHFIKNTTRNAEGRYVVRLPTRDNLFQLGESEILAKKRFLCTERRLQRDPKLKEQYISFMREYESLGHMRLLPEDYKSDRPPVYLPHHPVIKLTSSSTPVRVVFDASAKTSSGISLNDVLMLGPKTQDDIFRILLRFREHEIVIKADVKKMFRQIDMHPDDQNMQRIMWRESPKHPLQTYLLSTVTYGTGCASYLSTRCINQLVKDEGDVFPLAKDAASRDFYVDDFLSGAPTIDQAQELRLQVDALMKKGGFQLSKWMSNDSDALKDVPYSEREIKEPLDLSSTDTISTLGLLWDPQRDIFTFSVKTGSQTVCKRAILSEMSRTYDPLGVLAPVTIQAKILMQSLWQLGSDWDEDLQDSPISQIWFEYQQGLKELPEVKIPRHITSHQQLLSAAHIQLAVFCDASEKAFAACIYLQTFNPVTGCQLTSQLLCAKTRVAPLKQVSLPRLELCAAALAMRLLQSVLSALTVKIHSIKAFSDSTIVLHWLAAEPTKWKTFVANRVSQIQRVLPRESWDHVPSALNPADLPSRGLSPHLLINNTLWWNGPNMQEISTSNEILDHSATGEELEQRVCCTAVVQDEFWSFINRVSSHSKLIRCIAYWRRYFVNIRCRIQGNPINTKPLSVKELKDANIHMVRMVQIECFGDDINRLCAMQKLASGSRIKDLNPYIDEEGVLRVGGRIENARVPTSQKHPIILPDKHIVTKLIADKIHLETCHGGPQLMLYTARQQYWILRGLDVMKAARRKCVRCFRCQPRAMHQIMGNLPPCRLQFTRPFDKVGIDFCGYFQIKAPLRRNVCTKMYVAVFVCMITHAIHLELVTDLSTDAFLAALRRFIARRGRPTDIFCDNAKNFVGANRQLQEVREILNNQRSQELITKHTAEAAVNFNFIPPRSPHFGGMWESSVKSFKTHFYRIVGTTSLTQESILTILAEIEMCLNSRPLSAMSSSPEDFAALTPGHFLIGAPLNALPDHDLTSIPENRLSKWQRNQQIVQHFWRRFSKEVFSELQRRKKWRNEQPELRVGDLVVIIEDNLPPLSWILGRIIELHHGRDGHVRVVKIKTQNGVYTRAITRLARLPEEVQNQEVQPGENGDVN